MHPCTERTHPVHTPVASRVTSVRALGVFVVSKRTGVMYHSCARTYDIVQVQEGPTGEDWTTRCAFSALQNVIPHIRLRSKYADTAAVCRI